MKRTNNSWETPERLIDRGFLKIFFHRGAHDQGAGAEQMPRGEGNPMRRQGQTLPLGLLAIGDNAHVVQSFGPAEEGMEGLRLEEMGLRPGTRVEILANGGQGPLLLRVGEARIGISRGIAMKLQVRPLQGRGVQGGPWGEKRP